MKEQDSMALLDTRAQIKYNQGTCMYLDTSVKRVEGNECKFAVAV